MQIKRTGSLNLSNGVKCLGYGASGVGKTKLASSAPRPLILNGEKGLLSLKDENVPYIDVPDYKTLVDVGKWMLSSADMKNYDTIIVDSLSEFAEVLLSAQKKKNADQRQAFMKTGDELADLCRFWRDLPNKHLYIIAKELRVNMDLPNPMPGMPTQSVVKRVPVMPSDKLLQALPYYWDLVFHMELQPYNNQTYRVLRCQPTNSIEAKDRRGKLSELEAPDLTKLFQKIAS
jgi:hypothetical protein